tara:strand:- start:218 stop:358 length:141 start_codon:yes stop_codon:yes gene_type:complete
MLCLNETFSNGIVAHWRKFRVEFFDKSLEKITGFAKKHNDAWKKDE